MNKRESEIKGNLCHVQWKGGKLFTNATIYRKISVRKQIIGILIIVQFINAIITVYVTHHDFLIETVERFKSIFKRELQ